MLVVGAVVVVVDDGAVVVDVVVVDVVVVGAVVVDVVVVVGAVVVVVGVGLVVVVPVVVVVLVPVVVGAVLLTVVVCVEPFASLLLAEADVRLPLLSIEYCAEPVPPPQAASRTETLAAAVSDVRRIAFTLNDTLNISDFSLWLLISRKNACKCLCQSIASREEFRVEIKKFLRGKYLYKTASASDSASPHKKRHRHVVRMAKLSIEPDAQ